MAPAGPAIPDCSRRALWRGATAPYLERIRTECPCRSRRPAIPQETLCKNASVEQTLVVEHLPGRAFAIDSTEDEAQLAKGIIDLRRVHHRGPLQEMAQTAVIEQRARALVQR